MTSEAIIRVDQVGSRLWQCRVTFSGRAAKILNGDFYAPPRPSLTEAERDAEQMYGIIKETIGVVKKEWVQ